MEWLRGKLEDKNKDKAHAEPVDPSKYVLAAFLFKKGKKEDSKTKQPNWKKRFFIASIAKHSLLYYADDTAKVLRGAIDIWKITEIRYIPDGKKTKDAAPVPADDVTFVLVTAQREWHLKAETRDSLKKWVKVIEHILSLKRSFCSLKEGLLTKQGQFRKNWKSRYFLLCPGHLVYFVKQEESVKFESTATQSPDVPLANIGGFQGIVPLQTATEAKLISGDKEREHVFMLSIPNRDMLFWHHTEEGAKEWVDALNHEIHRLDEEEEKWLTRAAKRQKRKKDGIVNKKDTEMSVMSGKYSTTETVRRGSDSALSGLGKAEKPDRVVTTPKAVTEPPSPRDRRNTECKAKDDTVMTRKRSETAHDDKMPAARPPLHTHPMLRAQTGPIKTGGPERGTLSPGFNFDSSRSTQQGPRASAVGAGVGDITQDREKHVFREGSGGAAAPPKAMNHRQASSNPSTLTPTAQFGVNHREASANLATQIPTMPTPTAANTTPSARESQRKMEPVSAATPRESQKININVPTPKDTSVPYPQGSVRASVQQPARVNVSNISSVFGATNQTQQGTTQQSSNIASAGFAVPRGSKMAPKQTQPSQAQPQQQQTQQPQQQRPAQQQQQQAAPHQQPPIRPRSADDYPPAPAKSPDPTLLRPLSANAVEERVRAASKAEAQVDPEARAIIAGLVSDWAKKYRPGGLRALLSHLQEIFPVKDPAEFAVSATASRDDVKAAYKRALMRVHPDKCMASTLEQQLCATAVFGVLREAHDRFAEVDKKK